MSLSCQSALRVCARAARASPARASVSRLQQARRWQSTDAAAAPANPKIATIVDQISQLTLLETADLVSTLKVSPRRPNVAYPLRVEAPTAPRTNPPLTARP